MGMGAHEAGAWAWGAHEAGAWAWGRMRPGHGHGGATQNAPRGAGRLIRIGRGGALHAEIEKRGQSPGGIAARE
jgi:hypothetical protein